MANNKHSTILEQILLDIYSDNELSGQLAFKGGTCLMFFYGIDRLSTDLDFSIRSDSIDRARITKIAKKYLELNQNQNKHFTYFWRGSYEHGQKQVKIEINKLHRPMRIINLPIKGLSVATLAPEMMLAQKLTAITDRKVLQNRDLYDCNFMFEKNWEIDDKTIQQLTGLTTKKYLQKLVDFLDNDEIRNNVSSGLGEVLTRSRLDWAKAKLVDSLRRQIMIRIDSM